MASMHGELDIFLVLLPLLPMLLIILMIKKGKSQGGRLKCPRLPPGPPKLPIIGNLHQLGKHPHRALWKLSEQYGPLMHLHLGSVPVVVVSSSQMAEQVLKTHDKELCSRPALTSWKRLSYNFLDVALSPYSSAWRELKKIMMLNLLNAKKVEGFRAVREEEVGRMMSSIASLASSFSKPSINLSMLLHTLSNNIICRVMFGEIFDSEGEGDWRNKFYRILWESQALFLEFFVGDYFPWARWVDVLSGLQSRLQKNFQELEDFYREVIDEAHASPRRVAVNGEEGNIIVDVLLRLQREDRHLTEGHVKGVLMNLIMGGTDTTFATLEYAMVELIKNPRIMLKAQEEVRSVVGEKGKVEESDVDRLIYLKLVVKETLRLHPVIPLLIPREAMAHVTINGYDVLPKTRVIVNAWAIGRELDSWENPDEFIPERFMGSTIRDFRGCCFHFIPFGAGRRICPGLAFGITTVELALANLLYCFNWEVPDGIGKEGINVDEATGLVVHLKTNLHLTATKYKHSDEILRGVLALGN